MSERQEHRQRLNARIAYAAAIDTVLVWGILMIAEEVIELWREIKE